MENNWLEEGEFKQLLEDAFSRIEQAQLRVFLFEYCKLYHEIYYFEILEKAFIYLQFQIEGSLELLDELPTVLNEVEEGMWEYCFSLNEIASAVNLLLRPEPISLEQAFLILNHILEAYSCNEEPEDFLGREQQVLINLLNNFIK